MIFALAAVSVALIAVLLVGYKRERLLVTEHRLFVDALCKAASEERAELLERIQRPEHRPTGFVQDYHVPERAPDEWAQVGTNDLSAPRDDMADDLDG